MRHAALVFSFLCTLVARGDALAGLPAGALASAARGAGIEVGAAVDSNLNEGRRELAGREFTSGTIENSLKWAPLASAPGVYDFTAADSAVDFAEDKGLRIRGHTLFWDRLNGRPSWLPGELEAAPDAALRLTELMEEHAATVVGRYAGRLAHWDVVNEPLDLVGTGLAPDNIYVQTLGESYLDIAFAAARLADPSAKLFLNEVLTEFLAPKFDALLALVEGLLARGVPIDGIGLQGHFTVAPPNRASLESQLQRVAELGLWVELTEVDIPRPLFDAEADPFAAQAAAYADVFAACKAVPACTGVTTWGLDDPDTWLDSFELTMGTAPNEPLLFDAHLDPKPAYYAVVQVLPEPGATWQLGSVLASLLALSRLARRPQAIAT